MSHPVHIVSFLLGVNVAASLGIGLFFWRFWCRTHEKLFRVFAAAFGLMGLGWIAQLYVADTDETSYLVYFPRLLAFSCIIWAIIDKNRSRPGAQKTPGP